MDSKSSDRSRENLQDDTSEEVVQPASTQTGDIEEVAGNLEPKIPRPLSTPRMKVQS
jgi:hypothetical protein